MSAGSLTAAVAQRQAVTRFLGQLFEDVKFMIVHVGPFMAVLASSCLSIAWQACSQPFS